MDGLTPEQEEVVRVQARRELAAKKVNGAVTCHLRVVCVKSAPSQYFKFYIHTPKIPSLSWLEPFAYRLAVFGLHHFFSLFQTN